MLRSFVKHCLSRILKTIPISGPKDIIVEYNVLTLSTDDIHFIIKNTTGVSYPPWKPRRWATPHLLPVHAVIWLPDLVAEVTLVGFVLPADYKHLLIPNYDSVSGPGGEYRSYYTYFRPVHTVSCFPYIINTSKSSHASDYIDCIVKYNSCMRSSHSKRWAWCYYCPIVTFIWCLNWVYVTTWRFTCDCLERVIEGDSAVSRSGSEFWIWN